MPATNVPWPRPSPGELLGSELRFTLASTRLPKSARPGSMPESTTAIVGTLPAYWLSVPHSCPNAASYGQSWPETGRLVGVRPLTLTTASGVTVRPGIEASLSSFDAGISIETAPTRSSFRPRLPAPRPLKAFSAPLLPWLDCTITRSLPPGFACALSRSACGTYVPLPSRFGPPLPLSAVAARAAFGRVRASAVTASVTNGRPPLPHRALERCPPPRFPVPQSALERDSAGANASCFVILRLLLRAQARTAIAAVGARGMEAVLLPSPGGT